jgi:hypothetical protein
MTVRKRIYIACPISKPANDPGLRANIGQADDAMLALMLAGFSPFNPALSTYAGGCGLVVTTDEGVVCDSFPTVGATAHPGANGPFRELSHADWLDMDFAWVAASDAVLRLPGESKGADMETAFAVERGIPVFHSVADLVRHFAIKEHANAT